MRRSNRRTRGELEASVKARRRRERPQRRKQVAAVASKSPSPDGQHGADERAPSAPLGPAASPYRARRGAWRSDEGRVLATIIVRIQPAIHDANTWVNCLHWVGQVCENGKLRCARLLLDAGADRTRPGGRNDEAKPEAHTTLRHKTGRSLFIRFNYNAALPVQTGSVAQWAISAADRGHGPGAQAMR